MPIAGEAAIGGQAPVAPIAAELLRQLGMQRKAPPREGFERGAVAPVERQKATRFAGGRAGQTGAFDNGRLDPAAAQKIGD